MSRPTKLSRRRVEHIRMLDDIAPESDGAWIGFMTVEHGIDVGEIAEAFPHADYCVCGHCPTFPWEAP